MADDIAALADRILTRRRQVLVCRAAFVASVCIAGGFAIVGTSAVAAASTVTIEVTPSPLQLGPQESATIMVTVRNDGSQPINNVTADISPQTGITIQPLTQHADQIAAGGSAAWPIDIKRSSDLSSPNPPVIRVSYEQPGPGGVTKGVAVATVPLQDRAVKTAADIVDLRLQTSVTDLQGGREGLLYVVVRDTTAFPVTITGVEIRAPSFLKVQGLSNLCAASSQKPATGSDQVLVCDVGIGLAGQQSRVLPFSLKADQAVEPGPHLVMVLANVSWQPGGQSQTGSVTSSAQVGASVLGESQILTLLGIPSLFILPGFLAITTFRLLWKYVQPKGDLPIVQSNTVEFWFFAILLSLVAVIFVYPRFSPGKNLNAGTYSLGDIGYVWFGAVVAGTLFWFAARIPSIVGRIVHEAKRIWWIPAASDSPSAVLRKLDRNHWDLVRQFAPVTFDGVTEGAFVVYRDRGQQEVWVAPAIVVDRAANLPQDLGPRLTTALAANSPKQVQEVIASAEKGGVEISRWKPGGTKVTVPTRVPAASVSTLGTPSRSIVEEAPP